MRVVSLYILVVIIDFLIIVKAQETQQVLTIQLNAAINAREAFIPIFEKFEAETSIKIVPSRYLYDRELNSSTLTLPDISYIHDSKRLHEFISLNKIEPITELFKNNQLNEQFSSQVIDWISYHGDIYGIPYSQTTWGIYYKKEFVKKFGKIPQTWDEFLTYCLRIKKSGYALFPASKKQTWHATGWFQYFLIRMYEHDFYLQLTQGKISYHSPKIKKVLLLWQEAIKKGLYSYQFDEYKWSEYVPLLLRDYISFVFISNNFGDKIYASKSFDDIEFMPFPKINDIPNQEASPISLFFLNKKSTQKEAGKQFLTFIARPENQRFIAEKIFVVPPNIKALTPTHKISKSAHHMLRSAHNLSPFFDRVVPVEFDKPAARALTDFVYDADIEKLILTLEELRLTHYK